MRKEPKLSDGLNEFTLKYWVNEGDKQIKGIKKCVPSKLSRQAQIYKEYILGNEVKLKQIEKECTRSNAHLLEEYISGVDATKDVSTGVTAKRAYYMMNR